MSTGDENRTGIVIIGALGRMGREIADAARADKGVRIAGAVERENHPLTGSDYGECLYREAMGVPVSARLDDVLTPDSVVIDFSTPASTLAVVTTVSGAGARAVIGTTGLDESGLDTLKNMARRVPLLYSPNMGPGVNLLFHLAEIASRRLGGGYDIEIIESHHRHKVDAPSGTARNLGEIAARSRGVEYGKVVKNGRSGRTGERTRSEIGMHAVRGGDIIGDHTVLFAGAGERIELRHMAHSRAPFAQGAVAAARWLAGTTKPGLYSMRDVLGL